MRFSLTGLRSAVPAVPAVPAAAVAPAAAALAPAAAGAAAPAGPAVIPMASPETGRAAVGWAFALISAAAFATAGSFATPLIRAGWSPGAAVLVRVALGGLILLVPALRSLRGRWVLLRRNVGLLAAYGLIAVGGCQLFYFSALQTLTVGVALLLEYLGILMVVGWLWIRHGQRPRGLTLLGAAVAIAGLVLVLDLLGGSLRIDPVGVMWGLAAAVGLAMYFVLSSRTGAGLPPLALACGGLLIGACALGLAGAVGVLPIVTSASDVALGGWMVPWWVPLAGLAVLAAAVSYTTGIGAARRLGPKLASFVGLAEVLFAVLIAWVLLGQLPAWIQLGGGALIVAGVALVRVDEIRSAGRGR